MVSKALFLEFYMDVQRFDVPTCGTHTSFYQSGIFYALSWKQVGLLFVKVCQIGLLSYNQWHSYLILSSWDLLCQSCSFDYNLWQQPGSQFWSYWLLSQFQLQVMLLICWIILVLQLLWFVFAGIYVPSEAPYKPKEANMELDNENLSSVDQDDFSSIRKETIVIL